MKRRIEILGEDTVEVTLRLSRFEARTLARILRVVAESGALKGGPVYPWIALYRHINRVVTWPVLLFRDQHERPSDEYGSSEADMDHVVNGGPPYPLLSPEDMQQVWPQLEAKQLSVRQIAERLHVSKRTIGRWRQRSEEKGKGI